MHQYSTEDDSPGMPSIFSYLSAEVDWCEGNFEHSRSIAEYYNTISNVSFFIISPVLLHLNKQYVQEHRKPVYYLSAMLLSIGIFSVYFHTTLSYVGQLLDELSILWTLAVTYTFWLPTSRFPKFIKNRTQFRWLIAITTAIITLLSFIKPSVNAYLLNSFAFYLLYMIWSLLRKCKDGRVHRLAAAMVVWWALAIGCWITDKWFCGFCQRINFCYFHSFWHILIAISLLYCCPLVIYFYVLHDMPSFQPQIQYWPCDSWEVALPYLALRKTHKQC
uniref:Alkaline ceramidase n=2 Tax=Crocodylus porosus TaxID=8502 RepID=A0A7M4ER51_CROPO